MYFTEVMINNTLNVREMDLSFSEGLKPFLKCKLNGPSEQGNFEGVIIDILNNKELLSVPFGKIEDVNVISILIDTLKSSAIHLLKLKASSYQINKELEKNPETYSEPKEEIVLKLKYWQNALERLNAA